MNTRKNRIKKRNSKDIVEKRQVGGGGLFLIGVAGASGCGKTFFSEKLKANIIASGIDSVEVISCDNYYKPYPGGKAPADYNWDVPESIDLGLLTAQISELKRGNKIEVPEYDFLTSQRKAGSKQSIDGSSVRIVIVEGLFVLFEEELRKLFDLKIFAWLEPDICLARRLVRDFRERGKDYEETIEQYQRQVKPAYVNFIEPTKKFADIIISTSEYSNTDISLDVIKTYIKEKLGS